MARVQLSLHGKHMEFLLLFSIPAAPSNFWKVYSWSHRVHLKGKLRQAVSCSPAGQEVKLTSSFSRTVLAIEGWGGAISHLILPYLLLCIGLVTLRSLWKTSGAEKNEVKLHILFTKWLDLTIISSVWFGSLGFLIIIMHIGKMILLMLP